MSLGNETYWSILQLIAWAYARSHALVSCASDRSVERGIHFEEVNLTDGNPISVAVSNGKLSLDELRAMFLFSPGISTDPVENIENEILRKLASGQLPSSGMKNGTLDRRAIPPMAWSDLSFFEDQDGIYAGFDQPPRQGAAVYRYVRVPSATALEIWPDRAAFLNTTKKAQQEAPSDLERKESPRLTRQGMQIEQLLKIALKMGVDIKAVPRGVKEVVLAKCIEDHPNLFTDSSARRAWKEASKAGEIRHQNKDKFNSRGK